MSLVYYDKAIFRKIHSLYDEVYFASPEEVFKANAKKHNSKVLLPCIGIWRMPDFTINRSMYNDSFVRKGARGRTGTTAGVEYPNADVGMHGLPVTLTYQIDVYATRREVCDGITAEIALEMFESPWVNVNIESMGEYVQQFNVDIDDSISDNTSISEFEDTNRMYRLSLTITLNAAVIYRISESVKEFETVEVSIDELDMDSIAQDY